MPPKELNSDLPFAAPGTSKSRQMNRRDALFLLGAGTGASALVLSACMPQATTPGPGAERLREWKVMLAEATGNGDPMTENTNSANNIQLHVMEPLMQVELLPDGSSMTVVGVLAKSWNFPNPKTLDIEIRKGVKFHNGEELTSEHVKYSWDALFEAKTPSRTALLAKPLGTLAVLDEYHVRFNMPEPNLPAVAAATFRIAALARKKMTPEQFGAKPIGTGPYKVVEWPLDGTVTLEAWDGYRERKAFPDRLVFRHVAEPSTRMLELVSGGADIVETLPIEGLGVIEKDPKLEVVSIKSQSSLGSLFHLYKKPFSDKRVRQAINHAIDRDAIVRTVLGGRGSPQAGPFPPGYLGYPADPKPYTYDVPKAKSLLAQAGYANGFSFKWMVSPVFPKDVEVVQAVAAQLRQVGIQMEIQVVERARLLAARAAGDFDVLSLLLTWGWHPQGMLGFSLELPFQKQLMEPLYGPPPPVLTQARQLVAEANLAPTFEAAQEPYLRVYKFHQEEALFVYTHHVDTIWGSRASTGWRPYPGLRIYYDVWALKGGKAPASPDVKLGR